MTTKTFRFSKNINVETKNLIVSVPVENGVVYSNKFCPQDLLTGGLNFMTAVNGEGLDEFVQDCKKQVIAMGGAGKQKDLIDVHIAGLMAVVMDHISRCGRLIFGDLLIYMDCFSYLLKADGFTEDRIKKLYPKITRKVVESYPNYILNTHDLSPFKGSHFDFVLFNAEHQ